MLFCQVRVPLNTIQLGVESIKEIAGYSSDNKVVVENIQEVGQNVKQEKL